MGFVAWLAEGGGLRRLTRSQSQARTRERLLAMAREAFLRDGFARTSVESIAEAAGLSKGAVYSNFENKDELFLELLDLTAVAVESLSQIESGSAAARRTAELYEAQRQATARLAALASGRAASVALWARLVHDYLGRLADG
jgi:AcrR family transcriptional regulator